jgi:hypothetical protein
MRADIVKQPRFLVIATFVIVTVLIFVRMLSAPYGVETNAEMDMPLGKPIEGLLDGRPAAIYSVALLLMLVNGALITRLVNKYNLSPARTLLPIVMYVIMGYGLWAPLGSIGAGLVPLLLIVSSGQMIAAFKRSYTFNNVFNSAFCLGLLPLIYSASLPLVIILPMTLSLYRRTAREWIVAIAGLGMPLLLASAGWAAAGYGWGFTVEELAGAFAAPAGTGVAAALRDAGIGACVYAGATACLLLLSVVAVIAGARKMGVRPRKIYVHFICLALLSAATFFVPSGTVVSAGLIAVPFALISTAFFVKFRGVSALAAYLALLALVIAINGIPLL